jgi:hypothetical protein
MFNFFKRQKQLNDEYRGKSGVSEVKEINLAYQTSDSHVHTNKEYAEKRQEELNSRVLYSEFYDRCVNPGYPFDPSPVSKKECINILELWTSYIKEKAEK